MRDQEVSSKSRLKNFSNQERINLIVKFNVYRSVMSLGASVSHSHTICSTDCISKYFWGVEFTTQFKELDLIYKKCCGVSGMDGMIYCVSNN